MSDRFYIGEAAHGSSYIIDRASQRSAIGRSGSFVVVIDSGEASWVCAALNEKQDRDNAAEVEPTGERYAHADMEMAELGHVTSTTERCTLCGETERAHRLDQRGMGCPVLQGNGRYTPTTKTPTLVERATEEQRADEHARRMAKTPGEGE